MTTDVLLTPEERIQLIGELIDEVHELKKLCKHTQKDIDEGKCKCNENCVDVIHCQKCQVVYKLRNDLGLINDFCVTLKQELDKTTNLSIERQMNLWFKWANTHLVIRGTSSQMKSNEVYETWPGVCSVCQPDVNCVVREKNYE
jgi:UbiD family decarboxylase